MLLTCADVILRYTRHPILGTYDIGGFLTCLITTFALAYTQRLKGHITIDALVSHFPQRAQAIIDSANYLIIMGMVSLVIWQCIAFGTHLREVNQLSMSIMLPLFPLLYAMAFAFVIMWLELLLDLANTLAQVFKK